MTVGELGNIFKPFTDKLTGVLNSIEAWFSVLQSQAEDILNLKQLVHDELIQVTDELQEFTQEQTDFANRIKNLKTKVVRADLIFEFVNELRTGELKQFVTDQLVPMKDELTGSIDDFQSLFGSLTTRGSGPLATSSIGYKVFVILQKIKTIWLILARVIFLIKSIEPFLKKLFDKIERLEDIVMPQTSERTRTTVTYSKRPSAHRR